MQKYTLIQVSIIAVVLLILGSLTNVVGYQILEQTQVTQYPNSRCDCERENTKVWHFPIICTMLFIPYSIGLFFYDIAAVFHMFVLVNILTKILSPFYQIGKVLNCYWVNAPYFEDLHKIISR